MSISFRKFVALSLIFIMLFGVLPNPIKSFAQTTLTNADYPIYSQLTAAEQTLLQQQMALSTPLKNKKEQYISLAVLKKYDLVVYQNINQVRTCTGFGDKDGKGEYRYLGYNLIGEKVTNDAFPNDDGGAVNPDTLLTTKWLNSEANSTSWGRTLPSTTDLVFNTPFISADGNGTVNAKKYTVGDILKNSVGSTYSASTRAIFQKYGLLNSPPSIITDGSVKLTKRNGNVTYYNTFIQPMQSKFKPTQTIKIYSDPAATKEITSLDILPTQDQVTVYVKVITNIDMIDLGLRTKESDFISSVENKLENRTIGVLTSFPNSADVSSVTSKVLYRKDFSKQVKAVVFNGSGIVNPKNAALDIPSDLHSQGILKVKAIDPSVPNPEFDILYGGIDKTDKAIVMDSETIDKDYLLNLKDRTTIPKDSLIKNYNWFVWNYEKNDYDYFGWTKDTAFTVKSSEISKYAVGNVVKFKELLVDQVDRRFEVEHQVEFVNKPVPAEILPKAYIYPPGSVRAGQVTNIKGEGTSANGSITDFAFVYGPSFRLTADNSPSDKDGTFLNYGSTETTTLTVTDSAFKTASASDQTVVKHPLDAVMKTNGVYKINRTIELDSTESTGTKYYPIDQVTWVIKPMEGQAVESIKLHDGGSLVTGGKTVQGDKPKVDFKQLGKYEVFMTIHSTCTYAGETSRTATAQAYGIINVKPDEPPVAKLSVPTKVIRRSETLQRAIFEIWDQSYSNDGDAIGKRTYYMRYDTDNDKSLTDEAWQVLYEGLDDHIVYSTPLVGNYEFRLEVEEANESTGSPFWNPATDTLKDNTDSQPLSEKTTEVVNVAPITSVMADRKKVDLLFATDYEGSDLSALKTQVDLLQKELYEIGIDAQVKIINDKIKSGTMKAPVYEYSRFGNLNYTVTYNNTQGDTRQVPFNELVRTPWETRYQLETDYRPNYGTTIPTTTQINTGVNKSGSNYTQIDTDINISAPEDPYKKSGKMSLVELFGNAYTAFQKVYANITFSLNGFFEQVGINSFQDADLYTIDLSKIMAYSFRDTADKQLLFVTKNGNSLVSLSESFKDWAKTKNITVSAVTGGDLFDEYGFGQVKNIALTDKALYFQTDTKRTYKIGDVAIGGLDKAYPLASTYSFKNQAIEIAENADLISKYNYSLNFISPRAPEKPYNSGGVNYGTKQSPMYALKQIYMEPNGDVYFDNKLVATKGKYWLNLRDQGVAIVSEGKTTLITTNWFNKSSYNSTSGRIVYESNYSYDTRVINSELDLNRVAMMYTKVWKSELSMMNYPEYYNWNDAGNIMMRFQNGDIYTLSIYGFTENYYTVSYYDPDAEKTRYINGLYNNYSYYNVDKVASGDFYVMPYSLKSGSDQAYRIVVNNGKQYLATNISTPVSSTPTGYLKSQLNYAYKQTYPANIIKSISDGVQTNTHVVLCDDGKVYATGDSTNMRFGVSGSVTASNPIYEYRQITNAAPVSLNDLLGLSTKSKAYGTFADLKTSLDSEYQATANSAQITRLLGDTLKYDTLYADFEEDPMYQSSVSLTHDPTALENDLGKDANDGKTLTNWDGKLSKVGLYTLHPKVQDNPNEDDRFADYHLWNRDDMTLNVLVHRKPFAQQKLSLANHATDGTKMILTAKDNGSYDLDHQSEATRGITEVEWGIRASYESQWTTSTGSLGTTLTKDLTRGDTYTISYRVKDKEGEWSDPVVNEIVAGSNLLFDAKMKAKDPNHDLTKFQAGNYVTLYNVWSSYEMAHQLEVQLYDGTTPVLGKTTVTKNVSTITSEDFPEVFWKDIDLLMPKGSLLEKTYKVRITAVDSLNANINKYKEFPVTIVNNTPPTISVQSIVPNPIYEGDDVTIKVLPDDPDKDLLTVDAFIRFNNGAEIKLKTITNALAGNVLNFDVPNVKYGSYSLRFVATDPNGASAETTTSFNPTFTLTNLRINNIYDFNWKSKFVDNRGNKTALATSGIPISDMPVHTNAKNQKIKMGYAVDFKIDSKGLINNSDQIKVKASYFVRSGYSFTPVDLYVQDTKNGAYKNISNSLYASKSYSLTLTNSNRLNTSANGGTWSFKYYIPPSYAVRKGEALNKFKSNKLKGDLLVVFDIEGINNVGATFNYTNSAIGWGLGAGGSYGRNFPSSTSLIYGVNQGEVFYYDLDHSLFDDLNINREW